MDLVHKMSRGVDIMREIVDRVWHLKRDLVSDGIDEALSILAEYMPVEIEEYSSGMEVFSWIVPNKWTCREAFLKDESEKALFSYADHPLHVVSYSLPFSGWVDSVTLRKHLYVDDENPEAIPFRSNYYERDWGLCCSKNMAESLVNKYYYVHIDVIEEPGFLKVGQVIARGKSDKEFLLVAHLCHPCQTNDDVTGVAVGCAVMSELLNRKEVEHFYTYRFLILPESIGSICWLSRHEQIIPRIMGGLFLEMLGTHLPLSLQLSYQGDTQMDRLMKAVLCDIAPHKHWVGAFRTVVGNDERQFNAPGVRVPMLSLSRVQKNSFRHFQEYHTSHDTPEKVSWEHMAESKRAVFAIIDAMEANYYPLNRFRGEVFCSRYNLFLDKSQDTEANKRFFDVMFDIDGTKSVADIAARHGIGFSAVWSVVERLAQNGLVSLQRCPQGSVHVA